MADYYARYLIVERLNIPNHYGGKMRTLIVALAGSLVILGGCSEDDDNPPAGGGTGTVRLYMVDAPAIFDAVNLVVTRVEVHQSGADSASGWVVLKNTASTYNLLTFRNGQAALAGEASVSAGTYSQIRLIIGAGSNVVVGGVPFTLELDASIQNGLVIDHQFTVGAGASYDLTLDFNVAQSIILTLSGTYRLDPVIRVQPNETAGTISGTMFQVDAHTTIWTNAGSDTVSTTADTTNGSFKLMALPEGSYSVRFVSSISAYGDTTINGVVVQRRQDRNLGTVTLPPP